MRKAETYHERPIAQEAPADDEVQPAIRTCPTDQVLFWGPGGATEDTSTHIDEDEDGQDVIYETNRIGASFHYTFGAQEGLVRSLAHPPSQPVSLPGCRLHVLDMCTHMSAMFASR